MGQTVKLSIIIAFTRPECIKDCLEGLAGQTLPGDNFEVIIIYEGEIPSGQTSLGINLKFIKSDVSHPGFKRNRAAEKAEGELLVFIDDDVIPPRGWAAAIVKLVHPDKMEIWGGFNRDERNGWRYRIAQALQENIFFEGLNSHRRDRGLFEAGIHDLPLCNLIVPKMLFNKLGGFSENLSYFFDDVDFNYRAKSSGSRLYLSPCLSVHHSLRPLIVPYLKYKFHTRFMIGLLKPSSPHLYSDVKQLRIVHWSWALMPFFLLAVLAWPSLRPAFLILLFAYLISAMVSFLFISGYSYIILIAPFFLLLAHIFSYFGYTLGRITSFCNRAEMLILKKKRS